MNNSNTENTQKIKIYNICSIKSYDINAKKPPICWNYIFNNGYCSHNNNFLHKGKIINNKWHPSYEEIQHLKFKRSKL